MRCSLAGRALTPTIVSAVIAAALSVAAAAQRESTMEPPTASARAASKVVALSFLTGTWRGDMGGAAVEEIWSAPIGSSIMGCFRWCKPDGTPAMFEMLTITEEAGGAADAGQPVVRLRLRHFSATLGAKEERDAPMTLRLAESGPTRAVFTAEKDAGDLARVTYEVPEGGTTLNIEVAFVSDPSNPREPLKFRLKRS